MAKVIDELEELRFGIVPEAAVSGPMLLQDDYSTYLTFNATRPTANGFFKAAGTAIVEIELCSSTKFGYPNDEALAGHPLHTKGLEAYSIFEVHNSSWISLQAEQNKVSFPETNEARGRHFIFTFHDSTFECIAEGLRIEVSQAPFAEILRGLTERILRGPIVDTL